MSDNDIESRMLDAAQRWAWEKLDNDLRWAINGHWSIAAETTVSHIVWLARQTGVVEPLGIQIPLLKSGVYQAVCELIPTQVTESMDLSLYEAYWGNYKALMKSAEQIRKLTVEPFEEAYPHDE